MNLAVSTPLSTTQLDPGPLVWVIEQVRENLLAAQAALRKQMQWRSPAQGDDAQPAAGYLLQARHQVHQAAGAIDLLGYFSAARLALATERVLARFIEQPAGFDTSAQSTLESGLYALLDYLEAQRSGRQEPALKLFKQYHALTELAGGEIAHPADLWDIDWTWPDLPDDTAPSPRLHPDDRGNYERALLDLLRQRDLPLTGRALQSVAQRAAASASGHERVLWWLADGFFEALALGLLPVDLYAKRLCNRLNLQLKSVMAGQQQPSRRLAHELLFFCSQALAKAHAQGMQVETLGAIQTRMHLPVAVVVDYQHTYFGLLDPSLIQQVRKRIGLVKEGWSQLGNDDFTRVGKLVEGTHLLGQALREISPGAESLTAAIEHMVRAVSERRDLLTPERVLEVATALLFLEASFDHFQADDAEFLLRASELARRLDRSAEGVAAGTFAPWMEELYRKSSESQTMGTVVQELRHDMSTVERLLDAYFRDPATQSELAPVPKLLAQMRGVLSVLGMDVAAQALGHIRQTVENLLLSPPDEHQAREPRGLFDRLAGNIGTLGFLIDMLVYQPELAKSLFSFDTQSGELRAIVPSTPHTAPPSIHQDLQHQATQLADALDHGLDPVQAAGQFERLRMEAALAQESTLSAKLVQARELLGAGQDVSAAAELLRSPRAQDADAAAPARLAAPVAAAAAATAAADTPVAPSFDAPTEPGGTDEEDDLLDIFLEEADEVIAAGQIGVAQLSTNPSDDSTLTAVRRAFHTLKGSSRMVALTDFGEAAWALEQVFNQLLAEQRPITPPALQLAQHTLAELDAWTRALRMGTAARHSSDAICAAARRLRGLPAEDIAAAARPAAPAASVASAVASQAQALESEFPDPDFVDTWSTGLPPVVEEDDTAENLAAARAPIPAAEANGVDAVPASFELTPWAASDQPEQPTVDIALQLQPPDFPALDLHLPDVALLDLDFTPKAAEAPASADPAADGVLASTAPADETSGMVDMQELDAQAFDRLFPDAPGFDAQPSASASQGAHAPLDLVVPQASTFIHRPDAAGEAVDMSGTNDKEPHDTEQAALHTAQPVPPLHAHPATGAPLAQVYTLDVHRPALQTPDENIKVVGDLRIPIPLYTIYLNEADELVRRLGADIAAWSLQPSNPVAEEVTALAHQLRGSSRTVGLQSVGQLAEQMEEALRLQHGRPAALESADVDLLVQATEEIRRLLHQFAAGFLRPAQPDMVEALQALVHRMQHLGAQPQIDAPETGMAHSGHGVEDTDSTAYVDAEPIVVVTKHAGESAPIAASELAQALEEMGSAVAPVAPSESTMAAAADPTLRDSIDTELFPIFEDEASELLPGLSTALRQWENNPRDLTAPKQAMRLLHTFKGSARMAGAMALGDQAHSLEADIEALLGMDSETLVESDLIELIARHDAMNTRFERLREASSRGEVELGEIHIEQGLQDEAVEQAAATQPATSAAAVAESSRPTAKVIAAATSSTPEGKALPQPLMPMQAAPGAGRVAAQPVRVRAALLDRLVNQVGEVSIARSRLDNEFGLIRSSTRDLGDNLERLRAQVRDIELQADAQMAARAQSAREDGRDFDPLEFDRFTRFQELTRMMAESVNDLALVQNTLSRTLQSTDDNLARQARLTRELQRDLLRTRMVEFDSISERLYRTVRQAGKDAGKPVRLDIIGGNIEIDRGVLDRMAGTFEHILRNAVAHGLESAAAREAAGKPAAGTITLKLRQEGSEVVVSITDDGAGLDYAAIERKARATGLLASDETADEAHLRELIFRPGFSSMEQTSEIAGRGVGLDVVRTDTRALGGRVELESRPKMGSTFTLVLPLTTAVTQVVLLRAGSKVFAAPASLVDLVLRLKPTDVAAAAARQQLLHAGQDLPFFWLGALTADSGASTEAPGRTIPVVLIRSAAQRLALQVDEVLGSQEVVVKNLGPQLSRVPGLAGISVLPNGNLVLIYNPVALAAVYGEQAAHLMARAASARAAAWPATTEPAHPSAVASGLATNAQPPAAVAPAQAVGNTVLVVDDSITVRRVTQRFLSRNGYAVLLAKDGLDALEQLQGTLPDVVLTDIEMPRMDGFDLTRNIRADERTRHLPVIMITSRIADKHRNYAQELGVNHYLGKPYSEDELLGLIRRYMPQSLLH
ncbi:MAG: Hpt domain-containing protein [Betaproteobacteria bacterium]|nr:Hpt domain-containing protein [Betaproteobacteria bacterium]MDE2124236.1 Hpt domain-containing protein [Betaproteobacteria bacterium]MDE2186621.1 Hpt domain-containing protein [Betaproteobacteria bacterium]MDE2323364.1 Hpt domain-containing protein [Betaproteobacteria bacterium]